MSKPRILLDMTAGQINLELEAIRAEVLGSLEDAFIAEGRGDETPTATRCKTDPLSMRFRELCIRSSALRAEEDRRWGKHE